MPDIFKPQNAKEIEDLVTWALHNKSPLEVMSHGSKRDLGRPLQTAGQVDLSDLSGILLYEPEELILQALPGTPLVEIQNLLEENQQIMAFEPPDFGPLLGRDPEQGSLGGVLACNLAGPRRLKAGAPRDHFLGVEGVSGRGEFFKAGGRVVKNVTGYDVMKLLAGSYGTLAVMTQVTIKVLPRPEKTYSLLLFGLNDKSACHAMVRALNSAHEVTAAAHLPADFSAKSDVSYVQGTGTSVTALRLEGPGPSVQYRSEALRRELADMAPNEILHSHNSLTFWREVRDLRSFTVGEDEIIWRLSVPPTHGAKVAAAIKEKLIGVKALFDWGGGLIWLSFPVGEDAHHEIVRTTVKSMGGHATLFKAPAALRSAIPVFEPQAPALQSLTKRVKASFDPEGVLNLGRLYQDF